MLIDSNFKPRTRGEWLQVLRWAIVCVAIVVGFFWIAETFERREQAAWEAARRETQP